MHKVCREKKNNGEKERPNTISLSVEMEDFNMKIDKNNISPLSRGHIKKKTAKCKCNIMICTILNLSMRKTRTGGG